MSQPVGFEIEAESSGTNEYSNLTDLGVAKSTTYGDPIPSSKAVGNPAVASHDIMNIYTVLKLGMANYFPDVRFVFAYPDDILNGIGTKFDYPQKEFDLSEDGFNDYLHDFQPTVTMRLVGREPVFKELSGTRESGPRFMKRIYVTNEIGEEEWYDRYMMRMDNTILFEVWETSNIKKEWLRQKFENWLIYIGATMLSLAGMDKQFFEGTTDQDAIESRTTLPLYKSSVKYTIFTQTISDVNVKRIEAIIGSISTGGPGVDIDW